MTDHTGDIPAGDRAEAPRRIVRRRLALVVVLFTVIVGGHGLVMVTRADPWPFSCYPMYSYPRDTNWQEWVVTLYDESGVEIDVPRELLPRPICVNSALNRIAKGPSADRERAERLLHELGETYEINRARLGRDELPHAARVAVELVRWGRQEDRPFALRELRRDAVLLADLMPAETGETAVAGAGDADGGSVR